MRLIRIMERGGDEYREYKRALKMAKRAIEKICELSEDMEMEYSQRSGMSRKDDYEDDIMMDRRMR